jgi:predicted nucleic acid-binding protein
MKRIKIYLDTSVVSMLDDSSHGILTKKFFDIVAQDNYELVMSDIVSTEIKGAEKTKRESILYFLSGLTITTLLYNEESNSLAWKYVDDDVLTSLHIVDLLHVAYATVHKCDVIVSWNRRHIAKETKIKKVNACNIKHGYSTIMICTPQYFIDNMYEE